VSARSMILCKMVDLRSIERESSESSDDQGLPRRKRPRREEILVRRPVWSKICGRSLDTEGSQGKRLWMWKPGNYAESTRCDRVHEKQVEPRGLAQYMRREIDNNANSTVQCAPAPTTGHLQKTWT
jgi:hypothetical protein